MPKMIKRVGYTALQSLMLIFLLIGSASAAKVNYIYDELGRLIQVEYPDGTTIKYDYDKLGNRIYKERLKNPFTLTVQKLGVSSGIEPVVYSDPPGVDCGDFCEGKFNSGPTVTLTVLPDSDYRLTGWSGGGCSGTGGCIVTMDSNKSITATFALLPPMADFTASPTTVYETPVSFTDKSLRATSWYWEFGDGFTSTEQNPTHIFASTGTYTVSLTITNSTSGLTATKTVTNYITVRSCNNDQPVQITNPDTSVSYFNSLQAAYAAAAPGAVIKAIAVTLQGDLNANQDKSITLIGGYQCDYVGEPIGKTVLLGSITISKGTLDIRNIEIFNGTSNAVYHQISASSGIGGSISPSGTLTVAHGGSATYAIIPDQNYAIDKVLVDGTPVVPVVDTYQFHSVTANHVIKAEFVNVGDLPVADFSASPTTLGELTFAPVSFTDKSLRATTWYWEFGDGFTSTGQYPIHTYSSVVSTYTVTLTVTNSKGTDTKTLKNYITVRQNDNIPVQIDKPFVKTYPSLQEAYDAAADGAVIKAVAATLLGNLDANQNKSITLIGGFQSDYSQQVGNTILLGSITTSNGTLAIRGMEIITGTGNHQISASSSIGGSISPSGMMPVAQGGSVEFDIIPDQNYQIADVLVDRASVGAVSKYRFSYITTDHAIEAIFARDAYTISVYAGTGGTITPSGIANTVSVPYRSSQLFTITPDPGYHVTDVRVDGISVGAVTSYTVTDVKADHTIDAFFSNRYALTVLKTGNGSGSIASSPAGIVCGASCLNSFVQGSTITLTAAPQSNSAFAGWSGAGCSGTGSCILTLSSDVIVNAIFNLTAPPVADFSSGPTPGIQTATVNFYDLSTGSPTSWLWDFGDSLSSSPTSTLKNPIHTYGAAGYYTVTLTATSAGGSHTLTKPAHIFVQPYVKIAGSTAVYRTIQEAYNAAPNGATIQVLSSQYLTSQGRVPLLLEDLVANAATPKTITLEGGYEINAAGQYVSSATGMTTMKGSITTATGTLTIKNIDLRTGAAYTIVAAAGGGGSISPFGTLVVNPNTLLVEFGMTPLPGYRISDVVIDGIRVGARPSHAFTNITSNHSITAEFSNTNPLSAPSSLSATAVSLTRINLAWIDNSTTETGFIIERKIGIGGAYSRIALTGPGVTGYSDTGLIPDTVYYYRVRSTTALSSSVYSPEASASTADVIPPTCSIVIAGGAMVISGPSVTLSLSSQDDSGQVSLMQFSNDGTTWSLPETYATVKTWTLSSGDGVKTVYTKFKDQAGNWSNGCNDTIVLDTAPPTAPANLTATAASSSQINLSWTAATDNVGVTGHQVERCQGSGCSTFSQIATTTTTTYNNTGLLESTSYSYRVRATDAANNISPYSGTAIAITPDTTPPTAPSGLTATAASSSQINLSWTASTDNVGVTGYQVVRCQGSGCSTFNQIATTTTTTYNDTGLSASTSYSYLVRATDAANNLSTYTIIASAATPTPPDIAPPTAPANLTATAASSSQINLSWTASTDNVGVTGYQVERCQGSGCSTFSQIATTTTTTYNNTGLLESTSYSYRVRATDAANNISPYSGTSIAITPDITPPTAPSGFTATAVSSSQINLSWTAATDNVGVTGYQVERCQGSGCSTFSQIATATTTTYNNTGLTASTSYSYRVRATDAASNLSPYSSIASATTPTPPDVTPPTAPSGLTTTATSTSQINLSWTAATDNVGVTGYRIERCQGAGCSTFSQIATTATTTYYNTGLSASTSYSYRVRATDAANNLSPYSGTASSTTPPAPIVRVNKLSHISGSTPVGTGSQTTASFTPANSSLLLAIVSYTGNSITTDRSADITIAGGGLTWTRRLYIGTGTGSGQGLAVFTAPVTTGASMSLTLDAGSNSIRAYGCQVFQYTNYNTSSPVGATARTNNAVEDGAQSLTLSATPASTSEVLGFYASYPNTTVATTQGSGWTELYDAGTGGYTHLHSQAKVNVGSRSVPWADVAASGTQSAGIAAAIEIKAKP